MGALERKPNGSELVLTPPEPLEITPIDLLRQAIAQGVSIDQLERLQAMYERHEANQARKAFVKALNAFKESAPAITKNKEVAYGNTRYNHATLDHVCDVLIKGLSQHGISHRWKVEQGNEWIKVTCILTHELGHSEETTLMGAPDNSGSKNSIQAIGSTVTYLQRYTLLAATGLAAGGTDNDGRGEPVTMGNVSERIEFLQNCTDFDELKKLFAVYYKEFANSKTAQRAIQEAYEAKKRELNHGSR
jgi:hypothetical protein